MCNLVGKRPNIANDCDVYISMIDAPIHGVKVIDNLLTGIAQVANLSVLMLANLELPATRPAGSGNDDATSRVSLTVFGEHSVSGR